jgi:type IV secretory pathway VirD2 relaxase
MTARGLKAAKLHLAYLERDGVERDGSAGLLYGADEKFTSEGFRAPLENEQRQFRFIVSPEDGDRLDLKEFTREFMNRVEKDTGRRLIWAAVNHHNTDNPHVHIVIRGVDRDGDDVRIDGRYIGREMRWRAQEVVTRELGPRSEIELSRERAAEIGRPRFTEIDRMLGEHASPDGTVTLQKLLAAPGPEGRVCIGRLQVLEQLDLAHQERAGVWRFANGWKETLVRIGEREDMIQRLVPLVGREAIRYQVLDQRIPSAVVEGIVTGKGLDDELTGNMFAAVVTPAGPAYYVRLAPEIADSLRTGEAVRVGVEVEPWLKPADRIIAHFAQENGGIYDPGRHLRALENLSPQSRDVGRPSPAERIEANLRRLERLARYRLATHLPDGRWQIPANLVGQLETREKSHPQHRLRFERVAVSSQVLAPERTKDPSMERAALGQRLANELRMTYVSDPQTFMGRVAPCAPTPDGRQYVCIVDERNQRFTVITKPPEAERLLGRVVSLSLDREQRLAIRLGPNFPAENTTNDRRSP